MISIIKGTIESISKNGVVLMTGGGVGYEIYMRADRLGGLEAGEELLLFTYLKVGDAGMDLYGFEKRAEKDFFTLLLTVSGIGPKAAMKVLSLGSLDEIKSAIARGDSDYLTAVQGMGKKTAERLCVELKSKIQGKGLAVKNVENGGVLMDVIEGLVAMGYGKDEAKNIVQSLDPRGKSVEDLMKAALRGMK